MAVGGFADVLLGAVIGLQEYDAILQRVVSVSHGNVEIRENRGDLLGDIALQAVRAAVGDEAAEDGAGINGRQLVLVAQQN